MNWFRREPGPPPGSGREHAPDRRGVPAGFHVERVLVADRDERAAAYVGDLQALIGDSLGGRSGRIVGHDNSAPERTLTGPVAGYHDATASAIAGVIQLPDNLRMETPEYGDTLSADVLADPVRSLLYNRIER